MNTETLNLLIDRYMEKMPMLYDREHDELFKWNALKTFQQEWFAPAEKYTDFISRFNAATADFSIFMDNGRMHPRHAVAKLYEKDDKTVEHLFLDALFAPDGGDLQLRQRHMEEFIHGMVELNTKYFPAQWGNKMESHAAFTMLAMFAPADNFVYKATVAADMAKYAEFGLKIGAGSDFSLANYYKMCEEIVAVIRQRPDFIEKHNSYLQEKHYRDDSLHLLAFDLMYCSQAYNLYSGIRFLSRREAVRKAEADAKEQAERELKLMVLENMYTELESWERALPDISEFQLLNVEVNYKPYGVGTIIRQDLNKVTVRFAEAEKTFLLDRKYPSRPTFDNEDDILDTFGTYAKVQSEIRSLRARIELAEADLQGKA